MARILVLYYSSYGHISTMAEAVADGIRDAGHEADIRRVPETAPEEVVKNFGFQASEDHPLIEGPDVLGDYDGMVVGAPTRFGRLPSQMAAFLDTCGGVWASGALIGVCGSLSCCASAGWHATSATPPSRTARMGALKDGKSKAVCKQWASMDGASGLPAYRTAARSAIASRGSNRAKSVERLCQTRRAALSAEVAARRLP